MCPVTMLIPPVNEKSLKPKGPILGRICVHQLKVQNVRRKLNKQSLKYSMTMVELER